MEMLKELERGLFSPSKPAKISSASNSFFKSSNAASGETNSTSVTCSMASICFLIFSTCSAVTPFGINAAMPISSSNCASIYCKLLTMQ